MPITDENQAPADSAATGAVDIWPRRLRTLSGAGPGALMDPDYATLAAFADENPQGDHDLIVQYSQRSIGQSPRVHLRTKVYERQSETRWSFINPEGYNEDEAYYEWVAFPILMVRDRMTSMIPLTLTAAAPVTAIEELVNATRGTVAAYVTSHQHDRMILLHDGANWVELGTHISYSSEELIALPGHVSILATPPALEAAQ